MGKVQKITNFEQLLERIGEASQGEDRVSLGAVLKELGNRSFGPLLLVAGIAALAPIIGDIPGMPTILGIIVFLIAVQLLLGREHFWIPHWLLKRSMSRDKLQRSLNWLLRPAQFIDHILKPRLTSFTQGFAIYVIAIFCMIIAAAMPVMEVVPFSANAAGAALTIFGLSLIAHDGLLALIAFVFTAATMGIVTCSLI